MKVLGFAGSLRKGSYNKGLLRAALELAPIGMDLETFDLESIPPFNEDFEKDPPPRVKEFKAAIRQAEAILIATPEYNYSMPGVLKNAIDWASRPYGDNAFNGMAVAVMGASIGVIGTARAQYHLRQSFVFLNMYPVNRPEVMVTSAAGKFDSQGGLIDERARKLIAELLASLMAWAGRISEKKLDNL
jgi:chromate reductase